MDFWTGIIGCFDDQSTKKLKKLWKILDNTPDLHDRAYVRVPPHITLLEHEELRKQEYYDALEFAISKFDSFSLEFSGLTTFPIFFSLLPLVSFTKNLNNFPN